MKEVRDKTLNRLMKVSAALKGLSGLMRQCHSNLDIEGNELVNLGILIESLHDELVEAEDGFRKIAFQ
jgi:hypothetical protein